MLRMGPPNALKAAGSDLAFTRMLCRNVCRSVPADGANCGPKRPVPEHKTRGPHRPPRLFSPLLYQLSYLAGRKQQKNLAG